MENAGFDVPHHNTFQIERRVSFMGNYLARKISLGVLYDFAFVVKNDKVGKSQRNPTTARVLRNGIARPDVGEQTLCVMRTGETNDVGMRGRQSGGVSRREFRGGDIVVNLYQLGLVFRRKRGVQYLIMILRGGGLGGWLSGCVAGPQRERDKFSYAWLS